MVLNGWLRTWAGRVVVVFIDVAVTASMIAAAMTAAAAAATTFLWLGHRESSLLQTQEKHEANEKQEDGEDI